MLWCTAADAARRQARKGTANGYKQINLRPVLHGCLGYALKSLEAPSRIFMEGSVVLDRMPLKRCTHCLRTTSSHHNLIMRIFREH